MWEAKHRTNLKRDDSKTHYRITLAVPFVEGVLIQMNRVSCEPSLASKFGNTTYLQCFSRVKLFVSTKSETVEEKYHVAGKAFRVGFYGHEDK